MYEYTYDVYIYCMSGKITSCWKFSFNASKFNSGYKYLLMIGDNLSSRRDISFAQLLYVIRLRTKLLFQFKK